MTRIIAPKINLTKLKNLLVPNFQLNSPATEYLFPSPTNSITNKLIFTVPSRSISSISFFFQQSSRKKYLPFRSNTFCNPLQSFSTGAYSHCGQMFFSTEISKREGFFSKPGRKYYLILLGILFSIEAGAELFFLYKVPYSIHKFVIETLENNEILKDTLQSNQIEIRFLVKKNKLFLQILTFFFSFLKNTMLASEI